MYNEFKNLKELVKNQLPDVEFLKYSYSKDDNQYIVEPHYNNDFDISIFDNMNFTYRGILIDENGKLLASFSKNEDFFKFHYKIYDLEKSKTKIFETQDSSSTSYIIEDYKLKKIISRLISIIESYEIKPKKHERGSTELEHLLWMLYEIYSQKKPISKRYNWLGFVQGVLVYKNIVDIQHERDIMIHIF